MLAQAWGEVKEGQNWKAKEFNAIGGFHGTSIVKA
jgi:hypothetical protein